MSWPDHDKVVYCLIHDCSNDANLDLPSISSSHNWATCWRSQQDSGAGESPGHHHRRFHHTRHRLSRFHNDLLCVHIPPHDPQTTSRSLKTRYVCLGRAQWIYRCWNYRHGRGRSASAARRFHGKLRNRSNDTHGCSCVDESLDLGTRFLVLFRFSWSPLVMRRSKSNVLYHDMVLVRVPEHGADHVYVCYWEGFQFHGNTNSWLCHDTNIDMRLVPRCRHDGSGYRIEAGSLATKGRRQRRRWLQGTETTEEDERLIQARGRGSIP